MKMIHLTSLIYLSLDFEKLWNEVKSLSKEEQSERIKVESKGHPEIFEQIKKDLEDKEKDDLKRIYDSWKKQDQVRTRLKRILKMFKALNCLNSSNS